MSYSYYLVPFTKSGDMLFAQPDTDNPEGFTLPTDADVKNFLRGNVRIPGYAPSKGFRWDDANSEFRKARAYYWRITRVYDDGHRNSPQWFDRKAGTTSYDAPHAAR